MDKTPIQCMGKNVLVVSGGNEGRLAKLLMSTSSSSINQSPWIRRREPGTALSPLNDSSSVGTPVVQSVSAGQNASAVLNGSNNDSSDDVTSDLQCEDDSSEVYIVEDKAENAPDFTVLQNLFKELSPKFLLVGARQEEALMKVLCELCGIRRAGNSRQDCAAASSFSLLLDDVPCSCKLQLIPSAESKYNICKLRILSTAFPGQPDFISQSEKEAWLRSKVDLSLVSVTRAFGILLRYLENSLPENRPLLLDNNFLLGLHNYKMLDFMHVDRTTAADLQVFSEELHPSSFKIGRTSASKEGLSLFGLLNRAACPMSANVLRRMLQRPLRDKSELESRFNIVEWGLNAANLDTIRHLRTYFKNINRVNHLVKNLENANMKIRDWKALYRAFFNVILVGETCAAHTANEHVSIFKQMTILGALLRQDISEAFLYLLSFGFHHCPVPTRLFLMRFYIHSCFSEGLYNTCFLIQRIMDFDQSERESRFIVKPGVDADLDEKKRRFSTLGEMMVQVAELQLQLLPQEVTSCTVVYLPHIGYLVAIPPTPELNLESRNYEIPGFEFSFCTSDMILYKSEMCRALDSELGDLVVDITNHETRIMIRLVQNALQQMENFQEIIDKIIYLDIMLTFAILSREYNWIRPQFNESCVLNFSAARHPLYEVCLPTFVANAVESGGQASRISLITGPNASGKTVYLKQIGLICVLAHIGCYVPCDQAVLPLLDGIYTIVRSSTSVTSGFSTFMMELTRLSAALTRSTQSSLVLIDEFGMTTYEGDGEAILTACLDVWSQWGTSSLVHETPSAFSDGFSVGNTLCPFVFVATHILSVHDCLMHPEKTKFLCMDYMEEDNNLIPLYRVIEGKADKIYAFKVAELRGIPSVVIKRAKQVFPYLKKKDIPVAWPPLNDTNNDELCEKILSFVLEHDFVEGSIYDLLHKVQDVIMPSESSLLLSQSSNTNEVLGTPDRFTFRTSISSSSTIIFESPKAHSQDFEAVVHVDSSGFSRTRHEETLITEQCSSASNVCCNSSLTKSGDSSSQVSTSFEKTCTRKIYSSVSTLSTKSVFDDSTDSEMENA